MIVKVKPLKTSILQTKTPFEDMRCSYKNQRSSISRRSHFKPVLFCRYIGLECNKEQYVEKLKKLDEDLQLSETNYFKLTEGLEKVIDVNEIEKMKRIMDEYIDLENENGMNPEKLFNLNMGYEIKNECLEWTKKRSFKEIMDLYDVNNPNKGETARKNFGVKLLFWMNKYLKKLFESQCQIDLIHKIVFYGAIKRHELYFLILLSKLGCDIIYINPKEDIDLQVPEVKCYSSVIRCNKMYNGEIKFPINNICSESKQGTKVQAVSEKVNTNNNFEKRTQVKISNTKKQIEKSYEELALLAESVVMINVYDSNKELLGRGSGVVISDEGFIITNFHVVNKGVLYGIVFENDNNEYMSYKVIKYHTDYDLALIKVEKRTKFIKLRGKDLVRGQKIISIGSPLGLFNTISEGIVSGFRKFDYVEMVQITAPISSGSSGGALIDMYGNLAGITSAGFDGQNLNLTVPSKYVKQFCGNILKYK